MPNNFGGDQYDPEYNPDRPRARKRASKATTMTLSVPQKIAWRSLLALGATWTTSGMRNALDLSTIRITGKAKMGRYTSAVVTLTCRAGTSLQNDDLGRALIIVTNASDVPTKDPKET